MRDADSPPQQALARFRARADDAALWPVTARLDFDNLDRQRETLRAVYEAIAGARLTERALVDDFWLRYFADDAGGGLLVDAESYNYGLQVTTTRYTLIVGDARVYTVDVDSDNCAPEGGTFDVAATSREALDRALAALVAWHAANGVAPR